MKNKLMAILPVAALILASCEEDINKGTVWDDPNFIRITATVESVSNQGTAMEATWTLSDSLLVFDQNGKGVKVGTNDPSTNIFFSYEWTGSAPGYAVYPASSDNALDLDAGIITASVPAEQILTGGQNLFPQKAMHPSLLHLNRRSGLWEHWDRLSPLDMLKATGLHTGLKI